MGTIKYRDTQLRKTGLQKLEVINSIIQEYQDDNLTLTLRQLYYQLVSRDVIPNKVTEYAKLGYLLREGRMAGLVDWNAIEDRLREPRLPNQFDDTDDAMETIIAAYALKRMKGQKKYIEVWVEKDALSGVLYRVTSKYHIPIVVNRGYSSVTAMHDAYNRFNNAMEYPCMEALVLYLGDFDPSGQDMIRDIRDRIAEFSEREYVEFKVDAIALTKPQIRNYDPPPNPAKITDPRAGNYIAEHGQYSWEVDALPPKVLHQLLEKKILENIDVDLYKKILAQEKVDRRKLELGKDHVRELEFHDVDEEE